MTDAATAVIEGLPEATPLCSLVIPGSHDTMTSACTHPYYRTQALSLSEQLDVGVRYIDLRLTRTMVAAHREWVSGTTAERILDVLRSHLVEHPRDFLLVRIQNANEAKDDFERYGEALRAVISENLDLFWRPTGTPGGTVWPTIGRIRGRIVAFECAPPRYGLTRICGRPWAVPWHGNGGILLQDDWDGPDVAVKLEEVRRLHTGANPPGSLVLNHVSATNGAPGNPAAYAGGLNPAVLGMLRSGAAGRGVLICDFVDEELADAAWAANVGRTA